MPAEPEAKTNQHAMSTTPYKIGDWLLNAHSNQLTKGDSSVELEYRLTNLLVFLLENKDRVLTRGEILKAVWPKKVVNDDSVAVAVSQLRKALEDNPRNPKYIKTIPGVGYQFIFQSEVVAEAASEPVKYATSASRYLVTVLFVISICLLTFGGLSYNKLKNTTTPKPTVQVTVPVQDPSQFRQAKQLLASVKAEDWRIAVKLFREIIEKDPGNAQAYLELAEAKIKLLGDRFAETENYVEISALLNKALALDPTLAHAHAWLGELIFVHDLNPIEAEKHFKLSVALAPQDDLVHYRYAHFLFIYKRFSEAREQIDISRGLNPLSFSAANMIWVYLLQGHSELAERELNRIERTEESDQFLKVAAQNVYYQIGDEQKTYENMQWFFNKAQFSEEKINRLNQAFAQGGLKAVYQWLLDHKEVADVGQYTPPISWARYAVAVGDKKSAIYYLEQAFETRQQHVECAVADPRYAPLKDELKFKEFLTRFGMPAQK